MSKILLTEQASAPDTPGSGKVAVYADDAGRVRSIDDAGNDRNLTVAYSTADVTNPPTDAELDAEFGTPATVGAGFRAFVDDNGAGANFYLCVSDGTNWWIFTGTKAT